MRAVDHPVSLSLKIEAANGKRNEYELASWDSRNHCRLDLVSSA